MESTPAPPIPPGQGVPMGDPVTADIKGLDAGRILAIAGYLLVVLAGVVAILVQGSPDATFPLISAWLAFAGVGSLGGSILRRVSQVHSSVGPANGATVLDLLHQLKAVETYTHQRNHDLLNEIGKVTLLVPSIVKHQEEVTQRLANVEQSLMTPGGPGSLSPATTSPPGAMLTSG